MSSEQPQYEYEEILTEKDFEEKEVEMENAPVERRLGRFFAYRSYGSRLRDQNNHYHYFYAKGDKRSHCICGLISQGEEAHLVPGHRHLPPKEGLVSVFIHSCDYRPKKNAYDYGAYCQNCKMESALDLTWKEVQAWIDDHVSLHGHVVPSEL